MNFYTKHTLPPLNPDEIVCRIPLWGPVLTYIIFLAGLFFGIALFIVSYLSSTIVGMILSGLYTLLLWFVCSILFQTVQAARSPANWLARISPTGILIKYRSYLHNDYPEEDNIAVKLSWNEIANSQLQKETTVTRDSDGRSQYDRWFLNIRTDSRYVDAEKLKSALDVEHTRKPPHHRIQELQHQLFQARKKKATKTEIEKIQQDISLEKKRHPGKQSNTRFHDRPVVFIKPDTLKMEWTHITPGKKKLRKMLTHFTTMAEDQFAHVDIEQKMNYSEYKQLLATLIARDEIIEAVKLVRAQTSCSITEAKAYIENEKSKPQYKLQV